MNGSYNLKAIKVSLCPETGIPLVPEEIKERVRNGEEISIELMHGVSGYIKNAMRWNVAGLWIDGARISTQEELGRKNKNGPYESPLTWNTSHTPGIDTTGKSKGRYPKNIIIDSSKEVLAEFAKAGVRKSGGQNTTSLKNKGIFNKKGSYEHGSTHHAGSQGSAARYYKSCPPDNLCPACNNTGLVDVLPLDASFEEWVNATKGTREEYERLLKPGYMVCADCRKPPGRYPKNILVDGSEEVKAEFDKAKIHSAGKQKHPGGWPNSKAGPGWGTMGSGSFSGHRFGDSGSSARFYQTCPSDPCPTCNGTRIIEIETSFDEFMNNPYEPPPEYEACSDCVICPHCFDTGVEWPGEDMTNDEWLEYAGEHPCPECRSEEPVRFIYKAKSSKRERNRGLDEMDKKPKRIVNNQNCKACMKCERHWPNSTDVCSCGGELKIEEVPNPPVANTHSCVKPLSLVRYLTRISKTPTGGIVLDPFLGSGTTSLAAFLEGRASIGIEQSLEYVQIAANRLAYEQSLDPDERVK